MHRVRRLMWGDLGTTRRAGALRWALRVLVPAGVVAAAFTLPLPFFFVYLPGPVRDVERLVRVSDARTYTSDGALYMTTVSVDVDVTVADLVSAALDPYETVVSRTTVTAGRPLDEVTRDQRRLMRASKQRAQEVALAALGLGRVRGDGARIVDTVPESPADGALRPRDVIVSIDGRSVATSCDVAETLDRGEVGDVVELVVRRGGETETVRLRTASNPIDPGDPFIGVAMEDVDHRLSSDIDVEFDTGRIAGPSAGLMFTLALYDRLTPDDLTRGRAIAGTGQIGCGGEVDPIGGVTQKVAAAEREGADVFLAPTRNADEARAAAETIDVVAVSDFEDALAHLEGGA